MLDRLSGKAQAATREPEGCTYVIFEGAVRSSKTVASLVRWLRFIRRHPTGNLLMVGNTVDTLIRNVLQPIQDMVGTKRARWSRSTGEAEILGRRVYIVGAHDESARKRIQGLTLVGAYVDEVANVPESFFEMLTTRLSEVGAMLFATCNPEGPKHWLLTKWLRRARWWIKADGSRVEHAAGDTVEVEGKHVEVIDLFRVTFILDDNTWMVRNNPGFIARLKASAVGVFYKRNILSQWVSADGMVYEQWDEERNVIDAARLPVIESVLNTGVDFGLNHKTRGYALGLGRLPFDPLTNQPTWGEPHSGELRYCLFVLAEYAPTGTTVGVQAREFVTWAGTIPPSDWVAVDPAALVFRAELNALGLGNTMKAHNAVLPGIQMIQALLAAGRLFVVRERNPHLIRAMPAYAWDAKAADRGKTEPLKEDDDEVDAVRYAVYTSRRDWRDLIPLAPLDTPDSELEPTT